MTAKRGSARCALAHRFPGEAQHLRAGSTHARSLRWSLRRFERQQSREVLREEAQGLHVLEVPQHVHLLFGVAARLRRAAASSWRPAAGQSGAAYSVRVSSSSSSRIGCWVRYCAAHGLALISAASCLQRLRILLEQREIGVAPADASSRSSMRSSVASRFALARPRLRSRAAAGGRAAPGSRRASAR